MNNKVLAITLAGIIGLSSVAGFAGEGKMDCCKAGEHKMMPHHHDKAKMMDEFFDEVDATDAQKAQIAALHAKYDPQVDTLKKDLWTKSAALKEYVLMPTSTEAEAGRRWAEIGAIGNQIGAMEIKMGFEKKAILNSEQQAKAVKFMQEKKEEMHKIHDMK